MQNILSYCDYIAATCAQALDEDLIGLVSSVRGPQLDLHPTEGYMLSTAKKLTVTDRWGKQYRILVEQVVDND